MTPHTKSRYGFPMLALLSLMIGLALGCGQERNTSESRTSATSNNTDSLYKNACTWETADQYDGWGWRNKSKTSCKPSLRNKGRYQSNKKFQRTVSNANYSKASSCSYKDAHKNNGWGYDAKNKKSCPPK